MKTFFLLAAVLCAVLLGCGSSDNSSGGVPTATQTSCYGCFAIYDGGNKEVGYELWSSSSITFNTCSSSTPIPADYACDANLYNCSSPIDYSIFPVKTCL